MTANTQQELSLLFLLSFSWLADNCPFTHLNVDHFNNVMEGHVFKAVTVRTLNDCVYGCMVTTDCLSFNFYSDTKLCEYNSKNSSTSPQSLVPATGNIRYSDISSWPKNIAKQCEGIECPSSFRCFPSSPNPTCLSAVVDCGRPKTVSKAMLSVGNSSLGSVRQYSCWNGYHSNAGCDTSKMITTCQPTSQWTSTDFECWDTGTIQSCDHMYLTETSRIPDSALTASSSFPSNGGSHGTERARLNTKEGIHTGSWGAASNDIDQWIQVDLQEIVFVRGVVTQGRHGGLAQWVTKYMVLYSTDCQSWAHIGEENKTLFQGNADQNTQVTNLFQCPVQARCIRINPRSWNAHISMRFDVIGCSVG